MKNRPGEKKPEQPGTNGVRYGSKLDYVYYNYTATAQQMMVRVRVDPTRWILPICLNSSLAADSGTTS